MRISDWSSDVCSSDLLVVSGAERALLADDAPAARVEVLSNLHHVAGPGAPFAQRRDLVFVGGFRHPPNVDAVRWFAEAVFPQVRARLPGIVFPCIGGDVPESIGARSEEHTSELQSLMRISYAVFCLKKKK